MATFEPTQRNLREALLFCFHLKKNASEAHRMILEAYGEHTISISSCVKWFQRFKSGDFDTSDKERPGQPKKFNDDDLEALLKEDSCQTQKELAQSLGVTRQAISKRLKVKGMVQKQANWSPYEFKPKNSVCVTLQSKVSALPTKKPKISSSRRLHPKTNCTSAVEAVGDLSEEKKSS